MKRGFTAVPAPGAAPRHDRAVLYLHGRNDYFFQTWLADALLEADYEFYALDLRTCGRAGAGYWSPHDVRDLRVHDEEIGEALRILYISSSNFGSCPVPSQTSALTINGVICSV